jgi:hypothetical protein
MLLPERTITTQVFAGILAAGFGAILGFFVAILVVSYRAPTSSLVSLVIGSAFVAFWIGFWKGDAAIGLLRREGHGSRWVRRVLGVLLIALPVVVWAVSLSAVDHDAARSACASVRWCRPFYLAAQTIAFGVAGVGAWWLAFGRRETSVGRDGRT